MIKNDKNISLDDISFDDMLDEGIEIPAGVADDTDVDDDDSEDEDAAAKALKDAADADLSDDDEDDEDDSYVAPKKKGPSKKVEADDKDEDEDEDDSEGNDDSVVGQILEKLGYENDEDYEDTPEGLTKLTQDLGQKLAESQLDELFGKFPLVQKHLEYVLDGGDAQAFMSAYDPTLDYSKMSIKEDDTRVQKTVLTDYFKTKGHDESFIQELLEDYEDSGKLFSKAEKAKEALTSSQEESRKQLSAKQKEVKEEEAATAKKHWDDVYNTVQNSEEFAGLTVPKRERSKFFDYISKPVSKEGRTQRDLDHTDAKMEVKLAIDYLMYKDFNLSDIIDKKASTKSVKSLKDRISGNQSSLKSARKASRRPGSKAIDFDDLDLSL